MGYNLMKINIVCVGNIKEKYFTDAISEYLKRLSRFHQMEIIELPEERMPKNYSSGDIEKVKEKECLAIESKLKGYVIVLDERGEQLKSTEMAEKLTKIALNNSVVSFVIGGSWGLTESLRKKANMILSFSKFTFPHQLMRVVLLEQLYRVTTIMNNVPYAK